MLIGIDKIFVDHSINVRDGLDEDTIETYCEVFDQLPPVTVFKTTPVKQVNADLFVLADGFHRVAAARKLGKKEIEADVREGTKQDAEEWALLANLRHGKPLTRAERKKAVERMLMLHPERANVWIAEDMGVSEHTVKKYREDLESGSQIAILQKFVGKDGKEYPRKRFQETGVCQNATGSQIAILLQNDTPSQMENKQSSWRDNASPMVLELADPRPVPQKAEPKVVTPEVTVMESKEEIETDLETRSEIPISEKLKCDFLKMHNDFMELKDKFVCIETRDDEIKGILRDMLYYSDERGGMIKLLTFIPHEGEKIVSILYQDICSYYLIETEKDYLIETEKEMESEEKVEDDEDGSRTVVHEDEDLAESESPVSESPAPAMNVPDWQEYVERHDWIDEYAYSLAVAGDVVTLRRLLASLQLLAEKVEDVVKDVVEELS